MGEEIDRLIELAGTSHVSGYNRISSLGKAVHVGAYTRSVRDMSNGDLRTEIMKVGEDRTRHSQLVNEVAARMRRGDWDSPKSSALTRLLHPSARSEHRTTEEARKANTERDARNWEYRQDQTTRQKANYAMERGHKATPEDAKALFKAVSDDKYKIEDVLTAHVLKNSSVEDLVAAHKMFSRDGSFKHSTVAQKIEQELERRGHAPLVKYTPRMEDLPEGKKFYGA